MLLLIRCSKLAGKARLAAKNLTDAGILHQEAINASIAELFTYIVFHICIFISYIYVSLFPIYGPEVAPSTSYALLSLISQLGGSDCQPWQYLQPPDHSCEEAEAPSVYMEHFRLVTQTPHLSSSPTKLMF